MKLILRENNQFVLRLDRGQELINSLKKFCEEQNIKSGVFSGIGAAHSVILSAYDLDKREYFDSRIEEGLEISSLHGNISQLDNKVFIHAHGVFSDFDTRCHAGHVKELIVAATGEILLEKFEGKIEREFDKNIGLNLIS